MTPKCDQWRKIQGMTRYIYIIFSLLMTVISPSHGNPLPDWLDRTQYPFEPQSFQTSVGQMNYIDEGDGEVILFIHGNPSWSFEYRHLIKALSSSYRVIAPDHIGFGLSDKPVDWHYRPQGHAQHLSELISHLDLKNITMVINDWGGPIGLSYALKNPGNVARLVVTNSWFWPVNKDWYYQGFSRFMGGPIGRWLVKRHHFFAKNIVKMAFGDPKKLSQVAHDHYILPLGQVQDRKGCWVFPKQIIASTDWLSQLWGQRDRLSGTPTLILWGMKDIAFRPKELRQWIELFPNATIHRYDQVGHFVAEEAPTQMAQDLRLFLLDTARPLD